MRFGDEENKLILLERHRLLVNDFGAHVEMAMDPITASVISGLREDEICLAASTAIPLFVLDIERSQLENLIAASVNVKWVEGCTHLGEKMTPLQAAICKENEYLIVNRWAAARESSVATRISYAMTEKMKRFLNECTLQQIRLASRMGYVFGKLSVPAQYFYQAAVASHLTSCQRDALAISAGISSRRSHA